MSKFSLKHIVVDPRFPYKDYPCLRFVKAAEARHLTRAVAVLVDEYTSDSQCHQHRQQVVKSLVAIYDCIESKGWHLEDPVKLVREVDMFLIHYSALARLAMEDGYLLWSITPKFHFLVHLALAGHFEHPRLFWNYSGETFVGEISRIGHMVLPGKPIYTVSLKLLERMRVGLHLRLCRDFGP